MANENKFNDIWATLSKIDCSDKIMKKGELSYLPWAWAWGVVMDNYPEIEYRFYEHPETHVLRLMLYRSSHLFYHIV